jgi:primosomal protein N' (replication factor Y)
MVAKGLDFPKVTLVGVISADTSLRMPDFRAPERTYQLLSQVAGRAGRGDDPGRVIIQSFDPENYSIECAVSHDYTSFYEQEIAAREELSYPPFSSFVNVISSDASDSVAQERVEALAKVMRSFEGRGISLMGPAQAAIARLRGDWRWHLLLKCEDRQVMLDVLKQVMDKEPSLRKGLVVDVDPVTML